MFIADLHIHSKYSRATSKDCDLPHLEWWARRKGIDLLGTGDFTHPAWRAELEEKLSPAEEGLYCLKEEFRLKDGGISDSIYPRFVITGEISSIYKKNGRVRKVHNLIILPDLEAAQALSLKLEAIGNLHSDGRPILGLDSRDLLEITLETCADAIFIPAHIWTPHFSLLGAFSGFDSIAECFEDLTPHIHALETGDVYKRQVYRYTNPHKLNSRKRYDTPIPEPALNFVHCIFPAADDKILSFAVLLFSNIIPLKKAVPFERLLFPKFWTYPDGSKYGCPPYGHPIPSV